MRNNVCAIVVAVWGRSNSLSGHGAFHCALIAFACVVILFLSVSSPAQLAGTDWLTRQIEDRAERVEALNQTAVQMVSLDSQFAENLLEEVAEPADDDETKYCSLQLDVILRLDVASLGSRTSLYESSPDRALTQFRLRAFSSRGSPSA